MFCVHHEEEDVSIYWMLLGTRGDTLNLREEALARAMLRTRFERGQ
jgi:hypothetical protein